MMQLAARITPAPPTPYKLTGPPSKDRFSGLLSVPFVASTDIVHTSPGEIKNQPKVGGDMMAHLQSQVLKSPSKPA